MPNTPAQNDPAVRLRALEAKLAELDTAIDRQVAVFEKYDDPSHPVVLAAERRIEKLSSERKELETDRRRVVASAQLAPSVPAIDLAAVLRTLPDLRPALQSYTAEELAELFDVFDLEARYNHHEKTLKLSVTVFHELAELPERERPAVEAGRSRSSIAGAGFEPATSGL